MFFPDGRTRFRLAYVLLIVGLCVCWFCTSIVRLVSFCTAYLVSFRLVLGCENITIVPCECRPVPVVLMKLGLFGCAPVRPSLAVDIQVLQFCRQTFLRLPPNVTGWCEAVESFLDLKGVQFMSQVSSCLGSEFYITLTSLDA